MCKFCVDIMSYVHYDINIMYHTNKQTITNIPLTRSSGGFVTEKNTFPKKSHTALVRRSSSTDSLIVLYIDCVTNYCIGVDRSCN